MLERSHNTFDLRPSFHGLAAHHEGEEKEGEEHVKKEIKAFAFFAPAFPEWLKHRPLLLLFSSSSLSAYLSLFQPYFLYNVGLKYWNVSFSNGWENPLIFLTRGRAPIFRLISAAKTVCQAEMSSWMICSNFPFFSGSAKQPIQQKQGWLLHSAKCPKSTHLCQFHVALLFSQSSLSPEIGHKGLRGYRLHCFLDTSKGIYIDGSPLRGYFPLEPWKEVKQCEWACWGGGDLANAMQSRGRLMNGENTSFPLFPLWDNVPSPLSAINCHAYWTCQSPLLAGCPKKPAFHHKNQVLSATLNLPR